MRPCIFCQILSGELEQSEIYSDELCTALMDIYPWRPGHALVLPRRHVGSVTELSAEERARLFDVAARIAGAMRASELPCDDVHLLVNDGPTANQTIPHVHAHLVPRRRGDLWKLALRLVKHPVAPLLGKTARAELDRQAALLRAHLERG